MAAPNHENINYTPSDEHVLLSEDDKPNSDITGAHQSEATVQAEAVSLGEADERYGIGSWQPRRLQFMASPTIFVTILCFFTSCVAFFSGTQIALLTTLETRYSLSAYEIGLVITINTVGTLLGLPVASYLGGRLDTHRPRWIAGGAFIMAAGMLATCTPQFMFGVYQYQHSQSKEELFKDTLPETFQLCNQSEMLPDIGLSDSTSSNDFSSRDKSASFIIILISQFVAGLGYSPAKPLGISYIDDNVKSNKAGFYIGIVSSMDAIGVVLAFLASSATSFVWVDFYRSDTTLTHDDPVWVSAWWLLYIFLGFILVLSGIPFLGFPKRLPRQWEDGKGELGVNMAASEDDSIPSDNKSSQALWTTLKLGGVKEVFNTLWRLCTNRSYVLASFAYVTTGMITGLLSFFPKYMESQFGLSTSLVNVLVAIVIPALALGSIFGGYLCRRWNPSVIGLTKLCLVCATVSAAAQIFMFAFGCENQPITGISVDYMGNSDEFSNLTSSCNEGCHCADDVFQPVCWEANHITYISPCHAGCTATQDSTLGIPTFCNCTCLHGNLSTTDFVSSDTSQRPYGYPSAVARGACTYQCVTLVPFLIATVTCTFLISVEIAPLVLTVVRSVEKRDKPFAFGITKCLQYIIGVIPTPVITGALIDTTCKLWQFERGVRGACWVHDLPAFRSIIAGSGSVVIALQALLLLLCWYFLRRGTSVPHENLVAIEVVARADISQCENSPRTLLDL